MKIIGIHVSEAPDVPRYLWRGWSGATVLLPGDVKMGLSPSAWKLINVVVHVDFMLLRFAIRCWIVAVRSTRWLRRNDWPHSLGRKK